MALAAFLLVLTLAVACSSEERTLDERANGLEKQLICPVCPGETIDQSSVQLARDMRSIVREKLGAGETEQQIKDFFVARYGIRVLASPPASGFTLVVWILPPVVLVLAAGGLALVMRDMRRRRSAVPAGAWDATDDELAPYMEAVDSELGGSTTDGDPGASGDPERRNG